MTTSENIRDLLQAGLTQGEIAARSGTTQPTISRIYNGLQEPLESLARRIANLHKATCQDRAQTEDRAA